MHSSLPSRSASFARLKPPRQHRPVVQEQLSASEKQSAVANAGGQIVAEFLLTDDHFQTAISSGAPAADIAAAYTRRASAGRDALERLVELCRSEELQPRCDPFLQVASDLSGWTAWSDAPAPQTRFRLGETQRGAAALVVIGRGRCGACGTPRADDRRGAWLCDACEHRTGDADYERRKVNLEVRTALGALSGLLSREGP